MVMIGLIGTAGLVVLAVVGTAVGLTLFYRRNRNKQAQVNQKIDDIAKRL